MFNCTKAERAIILLGNIELEVFQMPDGEYRLSQSQVLEAIDLPKNWISRLHSSTPKQLKSLQAKGFSGYTLEVSITGEVKARRAKTVSVDDATKVWGFIARSGNEKALDLLEACAAETIETRANKVFGVQVLDEEQNKRLSVRLEGKIVRRELMDSVKDYLARHDDISPNDCRWMYVNASELINLAVFGCKAKKLSEKLGCDRSAIRDNIDWRLNLQLQKLEDTVMRRVDEFDEHPLEAVKKSAEALLIKPML